MSTSTDAILSYGIQIDEEWLKDLYDLNEELFTLIVYEHPTEDEATEVVTHCFSEDEMYILSISESVQRAWRGNPVKIENTDVSPEWEAQLLAFIDKYKVKTKGEIGWWLCSFWSP